MALRSHNSPSGTGLKARGGPRAPAEFWLRGGAVMCACPDCGAPMSIRLWLLVADCWQCGTSVELTEAQERRIQSLLRQNQSAGSPAPGAAEQPHHSPTKTAPEKSTAQPQPAHALQPPRRVPLPGQAVPKSQRRSLRDWLRTMPAWLISLLFHMALIALLALLMLDREVEDPYITLSTEANRRVSHGGDFRAQDPKDLFHYDLPIPDSKAPRTKQEFQALARANQDARELRVDPKSKLPQLPSLQQIKQELRSSDSAYRNFATRDPRVRVEMVRSEGGTTLTEAAVARGLRWLAKHQSSDGSWSLHRFHNTRACGGRCSDRGSIRSDSAGTSLALLPFLGAGQTHQVGIYQDNVSRGLRWLVQHQRDNGDLRAGSEGNAGMYAHGQAAIVLCEAYALTRDEQLRAPAQAAIDFIVSAQHLGGGWRYRPGEMGDTSVLGWQLMALQSARSADLDVPSETFELASAYLDSVSYDDGSRYAYQPDRRPTHVMTAEALLCRMYLGWRKDYAGLALGAKYLTRNHMPSSRKPNFYYWYYATQTLHHFGGRTWKRWNLKMRDILVQSQERRGHEAGSWEPRGGHASQGGRVYSTALAVCTLEVYYRHAPIFRQIDLETE